MEDIGAVKLMDMTVSQADAITRVDLDGRFDIQGAQDVDAKFGELAESCEALIVDLSKVSFIASLGIRTLMLSARRSSVARRHGGLRRERKRGKGIEGHRLQQSRRSLSRLRFGGPDAS